MRCKDTEDILKVLLRGMEQFLNVREAIFDLSIFGINLIKKYIKLFVVHVKHPLLFLNDVFQHPVHQLSQRVDLFINALRVMVDPLID